MDEYISREAAMSMPLANGQYDHEHANEHFILGLESYKEWLEYVPAADVIAKKDFNDCRNELCLRCGSYRESHLGACDGCRWQAEKWR